MAEMGQNVSKPRRSNMETRLYDWNTKPISMFLSSASSELLISFTLLPTMVIEPDVGESRVPTKSRTVVFPDPDGVITTKENMMAKLSNTKKL